RYCRRGEPRHARPHRAFADQRDDRTVPDPEREARRWESAPLPRLPRPRDRHSVFRRFPALLRGGGLRNRGAVPEFGEAATLQPAGERRVSTLTVDHGIAARDGVRLELDRIGTDPGAPGRSGPAGPLRLDRPDRGWRHAQAASHHLLRDASGYTLVVQRDLVRPPLRTDPVQRLHL